MPLSRRLRPRLQTIFAVLFLALASLRGAEAGLNRWTPIGPSVGFLITEITADPHDPAILYAKTFNTGVWRSGDGGDSWVSITSSLPEFVNGFAVDAVAPGVLYVTVENLANGALSVWSSADRGESSRLAATERKSGNPFTLAIRGSSDSRSERAVTPRRTSGSQTVRRAGTSRSSRVGPIAPCSNSSTSTS